MLATTTNRLGKVEKNAKVKAGPCIFPFKFKRETHNECIDSDKGKICATEINEKTGTLTKYGYCASQNSLKKGTKKKTPKQSSMKKLKNFSRSKSKSSSRRKSIRKSKSKSKTKSKSKSKSKSPVKKMTVKKGRKLKIVKSLKEDSPQMVDKPMEPVPKVYNEEFINVLEQLATIMQKQGEPFRARAYQKAQETIMTFPGDITSASQLKGLPGIGTTILAKLEEYQKTGTLAVLEREKNNPLNVLTNIYGVGPKKAKDLIENNLDTIEKIQALSSDELKKIFNKNQLKGIQYYDDINQKIPRAEIVEFDKEFSKVMKECCNEKGNKFEIVGSYRRGKDFSGDIDVIITNEDDKKEVFEKFIDALKEKKILEYTFSKGPTKSLTMCRLTPQSKVARRVDFLYTSPSEYPFALLYFTGSKIFNTVMRQRALSMGYTLNEHGLSHMKGGVKGAKVDHEFKSEKDIFDFLNMDYKKPEERIDGRAVQAKTASQITSEQASVPQNTIIMKEEESSQAPVKRKPVVRKTIKKKPIDQSKEIAGQFKKLGISYLQTLTESELVDLIVSANDAYYNKKPFLTDDEFDIVKEFVEMKFPTNTVLKAIGAPVEKGKVKLPFNMPSMNKIKPDTDALAKWKRKYTGPYVLSAKLDGVSGMYVLKSGDKPQLYTRGDGTFGQNVSHLIPYMKFPAKFEKGNDLVIRGEFIIKKELFDEKYSKEFSNPRNFVAGVINSKTKMPSRFRDIDFVAYEVIIPSLKPSAQFDLLSKVNINVVWNKVVSSAEKLTNELLSNELVKLREKHSYEIDGVIVANDKIYERTPENPEHAFAFKMVLGDQVAEVKVLDVLWSPSKDGYLKPRVQVEPVVLGGAKIEYATGFNAKFIEDNKIGVGAVIELVRSGDVIPHILKVVKPAEQPMMPDVPWKWNETHVDAVLEDKSQDETVVIKTITLFFKHLDTAGMGPGNVTKLVVAGFNSLPKILDASEAELQKILGKKTGEMAHKNILNAVEKADLPKLMTATNIFGRGFGEKRFVSILNEYPDILISSESAAAKTDKVSKLKGMSKKSAEEFVSNIPEFMNFLDEAKLTSKLTYKSSAKVDTGHVLSGKKIVMTGFRDKDLQKAIEAVGGDIAGSVSKNTFVVLVKDITEDTGKADQARKLGIPLMTPSEFSTKYL